MFCLYFTFSKYILQSIFSLTKIESFADWANQMKLLLSDSANGETS